MTTTGNTPTVTFPSSYGPDLANAHTVTLTFTAVVNDVRRQRRRHGIPNTASFATRTPSARSSPCRARPSASRWSSPS